MSDLGVVASRGREEEKKQVEEEKNFLTSYIWTPLMIAETPRCDILNAPKVLLRRSVVS